MNGCTTEDLDEMRRNPTLYSVRGTVTLDGEPLGRAMLMFLHEELGTACLGETDENGNYTLAYQHQPGAPAGSYKVAITQLVNPEGEVVGMDVRAQFRPSPLLRTAREVIPQRYSDLGRTILTATVPRGGTTIDFALEGPLLPPPPPVPEELD